MSFDIVVSQNRAVCETKEKLTQNSAGVEVSFSFSDEWEGLQRFACFKAYDLERVVPVSSGNTAKIPVQVLSIPGVHLICGIYGINTAGSIAIPTVYADMGVILAAADPSGASNYDVPDEALSAQILKLAQQAQQSAGIAVSGVGAGSLTFSVVDGDLIETRTVSGESQTVNLGTVSAYGTAVDHGYDGTEEEFAALMTTNASTTTAVTNAVAKAEAAKTAADDAAAAAAAATANITRLAATVTDLSRRVTGAQAQVSAAQLTLDSGRDNWTVVCTGVTDTCAVIALPSQDSRTDAGISGRDNIAAYTAAGILCTEQGEDYLKFAATAAPSISVLVNVLIIPMD